MRLSTRSSCGDQSTLWARVDAQSGHVCCRLLCREHPALAAHLGGGKRFEHGGSLSPAGDHAETAMRDGNARLRRDLGPDVARAHGTLPACARLLTGHGDEAEIADRGADRLRVAIDDDHPLAEPCGGQRMRKADDAGADDGDVKCPAGRGVRRSGLRGWIVQSHHVQYPQAPQIAPREYACRVYFMRKPRDSRSRG